MDATPSRPGDPPQHELAANVLVVVDFPPLCRLINQYLLDDGYTVEVADNGRDGLARFQRNPFDLVITDNLMPEMTGPQMATEIKGIDPYMPIILLTGTLDTLPKGVDFLVKKPVLMAKLSETVKTALWRRMP